MSAANETKFRLFSDLRPILAGMLLALCCLAAQRAAGGPQERAALTQHRINEYAACLQRTRVTLIEATGLRRPQEPLPAYFERIVGAFPGETARAYAARIQGYVAALSTAERETASLCAIPALHRDDAANRKQWQRIARSLSQLPPCVRQARAAWQGLRKEERRNWQSSNPAVIAAPYRRLGAELTQAIELILVAYNALRDAEP